MQDKCDPLGANAVGDASLKVHISTGTVSHDAACAHLFGFSDGLLERPVSSLIDRVHPDDREHLGLAEGFVQDHHGVSPHRFRIQRPDGSTLAVESHAQVAVRSDGGHAAVVVGTLRLISPAEVGIPDGADVDPVEDLPAAIMRYSLLADGSDNIGYISPGCTDIWELSPEEIESDSNLLWDMIVSPDVQPMRDSIRLSAETLQEWDHKFRVRTPSGKEKWLRGVATPTRSDDGVVTWTGLFMDITLQVNAEHDLMRQTDQLHQTQKLEALGKLTGGVAHDFNNLLSVIVGNLELLREEPDAPDRDTLIGQAITAAFRGSALTRQMLAYARRAQLAPKDLDPVAFLASVKRSLRRALPENIDLRFEVGAPAPAVNVDDAQLETALLNLAYNARDAMPGGGILQLDVRVVDLGETDTQPEGERVMPGRYVVISMTDNGNGMGAEVLDHAFDPFFTTKPVGLGSGLGLSTVLGFTRQSGGTTRLSSKVGSGTKIDMWFPAIDRTGALLRTPVATDHPPTELSILLVEDEIDVLRMLERQLASVGHSVISKMSGDAALAMVKGGLKPDLLLSDVVMPGTLQGPDLAREVRKILPGIALIFISGYPKDSSRAKLDSFVDATILSKPVPKSQLLDAVAMVARGNG
jgi:PAS domain S-box-containing protein